MAGRSRGNPKGKTSDGLWEEISAAPSKVDRRAAVRWAVGPTERARMTNGQRQKEKMHLLPERRAKLRDSG
jgi:hypothetical protein